MPYSHLTCPFSGGTSALKTFRVSALLQILDQSFVFFFCLPLTLGPQKLGQWPPRVLTVSAHRPALNGSKGLPCEQTPCWPARPSGLDP